MKKIVIIASSRDPESKVFEIAKDLMAYKGQVRYVMIDPMSYEVHLSHGTFNVMPLECPKTEASPGDDILKIKNHLLSADLLLVVSPVCSDTINGDLKTMLATLSDWLKLFKLANKPLILITTSTTVGGGHVLDNLETTFNAYGATVLRKVDFSEDLSQTDYKRIIKDIQALVAGVVRRHNLSFKPNATQEGLYNIYKEMISLYPKDNEEYIYWQESGLLQCSNLWEYYENLACENMF